MNRLPLMADWRLTFGTQLGRSTLVLLLVAAFLAVAVSAFALWRERRRGRAVVLLGLRVLAVLPAWSWPLRPGLSSAR